MATIHDKALKELRDYLDTHVHGWQTKVSALVGKTRNLVHMVSKGERRNDAVIEAMLTIAEQHKQRVRSMEDRIKELAA